MMTIICEDLLEAQDTFYYLQGRMNACCNGVEREKDCPFWDVQIRYIDELGDEKFYKSLYIDCNDELRPVVYESSVEYL